jgi:hypothetical protein
MSLQERMFFRFSPLAHVVARAALFRSKQSSLATEIASPKSGSQ